MVEQNYESYKPCSGSSVGQKYGLERGEEGSVRKHVPQSAMYQESNKVETVIADAVQSIPETNSLHSESERNCAD